MESRIAGFRFRLVQKAWQLYHVSCRPFPIEPGPSVKPFPKVPISIRFFVMLLAPVPAHSPPEGGVSLFPIRSTRWHADQQVTDNEGHSGVKKERSEVALPYVGPLP